MNQIPQRINRCDREGAFPQQTYAHTNPQLGQSDVCTLSLLSGARLDARCLASQPELDKGSVSDTNKPHSVISIEDSVVQWKAWRTRPSYALPE